MCIGNSAGACQGRALQDLLWYTPRLKQALSTAMLHRGCANDAARLKGWDADPPTCSCCQHGMQHGMVLDAEVGQLCAWVGILRHLRQLHLQVTCYGHQFAQVGNGRATVSCNSPARQATFRFAAAYGVLCLYCCSACRTCHISIYEYICDVHCAKTCVIRSH
jgi:hypothetical protein